MSHRGILSNKIYVSIEVTFDKVWDDLSSDEQKEVITSNMDMIDNDTLVSELESRGYTVSNDE